MSDPTTKAAWIVKGEAELGPQRRCKNCREWWPLTVEFWESVAYTATHRIGPGRWPSTRLATPKPRRSYLQPCRSCRVK